MRYIIKNRLLDLRIEKGSKQEELANLLNVAVSTYSRYEKHELQIPKKRVELLCKFFNIPLRDLFEVLENEPQVKTTTTDSLKDLSPVMIDMMIEIHLIRNYQEELLLQMEEQGNLLKKMIELMESLQKSQPHS